jgi:hypothetical protein
MKYWILAFSSLVMLATNLLAGSGSASVPYIAYYRNGTNFFSTTVYLSNITDHPVKASVKFYASDGSLISTSLVSFDNWSNANAEIGGKKSAYVLLSSSATANYVYGRAVIEWQDVSGYDSNVALICYAVHSEVSSYGGFTKTTCSVNNGFPF